MRFTDAAILLGALIVSWSFYRAQKDPNTSFDIFDLVRENGRLSRIAVAFLTLLCVSSWIMARLTVEGKLTEGYFGLYGTMWVAPIIAKLFSPPPTPGTTTNTSTQTTTTEVAP